MVKRGLLLGFEVEMKKLRGPTPRARMEQEHGKRSSWEKGSGVLVIKVCCIRCMLRVCHRWGSCATTLKAG